MIKYEWVVLATFISIYGSFAFIVPAIPGGNLNLNETCLNHTDIVVPSIHTSKVVNATSSVVPAKESCDPEFEWDGTTCVKSIVGEVYCSDNYELVDGVCQIVESSECPSGYHHTESGECVIRVEFEVKCPPEHTWTEGRCVKSVAGVCPVGTDMENGICVKTHTSAGHCSAGFELIGTQCRRREDTICDDNYEMINGECVFHERIPPVYKCPDDMILDGKQCVSQIQKCPSGYVLEGSSCVNVTITCPPDAKMDANNQCVKTQCLPVPPRCMDGLELINGLCVEKRPVTCKTNWILVNRTTCVLPCDVFEAQCPADYYLKDGWCYSIRGDISVPVRPFCTGGFSLQGNWCVRLVTNPNCTVIPPRCEPGHHIINDICVRNQTCPSGYLLVNNRCESQTECLPGYIWSRGTCIKIPATNPVPPMCPIGFELRDGLCYQVFETTTTTPTAGIPPFCPTNYTLVDRWCVANPNKTKTCQDGYTLYNGTCQHGIPPFCPPNYYLVNGQCVCTKPDTNSTTSVPPLPPKPPTCPNGYRYDLSTNLCVPVVVNCPFGFERAPDGHCYPLKPVCRPGYHYRDGACYPNKDKDPITRDTTTTTQRPNTNETVVTCHNSGTTCTHEIRNIVTIDKPVHVDTRNENNIIVHLYENGRKIQISRNNETQYFPIGDNEIEDEVTETLEESETEIPAAKCCQVVSPRKCVCVNDEWQCTQRQTRRCGWFCTKSMIYLRPRRTIYREPMLVMRPPPVWYRWGQQWGAGGSIDCSGCVSGGYSCSRECYQYNTCTGQDDCAYVDQRQFCQTYAGEGCAEQDGYLE